MLVCAHDIEVHPYDTKSMREGQIGDYDDQAIVG